MVVAARSGPHLTHPALAACSVHSLKEEEEDGVPRTIAESDAIDNSQAIRKKEGGGRGGGGWQYRRFQQEINAKRGL